MPNRTDDAADPGDSVTDRGSRSSIPRWYWLAYLTGGFGLAFNSMITFLLPLRANDLGISIAWIGVLLGTKGLVEAVVSVPVGGLIDRIGPRRAFIIGTAGVSMIIVLFGLATTVVALLLLQAAAAVLRPMAWLGAQSFVSGLREGADQARDTGRLSLVANGSQIVAPLLVGFTAQVYNTGIAFYAFAGYCSIYVVVGLLIPKGADAASKHATQQRGLVAGLRLLSIRGMRVVMFLTFARLWIAVAFTAFFPLMLVTGGASEGSAATVVSASAVVATIMSPMSGRLAERMRLDTVAAVAVSLGALGLTLAPLLDSIPSAYVVSFLLGIGKGLSLPILLVLVSRAVSADKRGLALGLRGSVSQTAAAFAPVILAAVIAATTASIGFVLAAAVALGFAGSATFTSRREQEPHLEPE